MQRQIKRNYKINKSRIRTTSALLVIGMFGISILTLSAIAIATLSSNNVHADSLGYEIKVNPSLNISVSSSTVSMTLNPASKAFDTNDLTVSVGTNNPNGYKLYLNADTTDLTNRTYTDLVYINTLSSTVTEDDFRTNSTNSNQWGYRISSGTTGDSDITSTTNFFPFESGKLISSSDEAVDSNKSTVSFAAKVDYNKPAGTYALDLSFKALPIITTYNMQNLDPTVCTADSTIVTDARDGQSYAIARLADGKCWMLQNLKLGKGLSTTDELTLTPTDSDVSASGFTLKNKLEDGHFHSYTVDGTPYQNNSSEYYCTNDYGCYYNWYTSTAGSGTTSTSTDGTSVDYSICPSGWTLPTKDDFVAMATSYGYGTDTDATVATRMLVSDPTTATENINGGDRPGILLGGGYYATGSSSTGISGLYWTRTAHSDQLSNDLGITTTSVNPTTNHANKYSGRPLRCLLK